MDLSTYPACSLYGSGSRVKEITFAYFVVVVLRVFVILIMRAESQGNLIVFLFKCILSNTNSCLELGPYKCNGVPIRRINQAYVIVTSTTVDISNVDVPEHIDDAYFSKVSQPKEGEEGFFSNQEKINPEWLEGRKADQKIVDTQLIKELAKTKFLKEYLGAKFTLSKGQAPHTLTF